MTKDNTKMVKISAKWHKTFKIASAMTDISIKDLMQKCFEKAKDKVWKDYGIKEGVSKE